MRGNIIPNEVMMSGTIRTFEAHVLARVLRRIDEIVRGVTSGFGRRVPVRPLDTAGRRERRRMRRARRGRRRPRCSGRSTSARRGRPGADDMAYFLEAAPGAYFMLGAAPPHAERVYPHHHPKFDFDEAALPIGIELGPARSSRKRRAHSWASLDDQPSGMAHRSTSRQRTPR